MENRKSGEGEESSLGELINKWQKVTLSFSPNERETVEYLRWMGNHISYEYRKFTKQELDEYTELEVLLWFAWGRYVELLDVYGDRKEYLRNCDKKMIQEQIFNTEKNIEYSNKTIKDLELYNLDILQKRLIAIDKIELVNQRLVLHLQVIENFFHLVKSEVFSLTPTNCKLSIDFDSFFSNIHSTLDFIKQTEAFFDTLLQKKLDMDADKV